jgi:ribosome-binding protein aMBF1 (putative translation factor)
MRLEPELKAALDKAAADDKRNATSDDKNFLGLVDSEGIFEVSGITIRQVKAARNLLGWSQETLAKHSRVNLSTIQRLEGQGGNLGGYTETRDKIIAAFEEARVRFIGNDGVIVKRDE